jgi:hypothetical protein
MQQVFVYLILLEEKKDEEEIFVVYFLGFLKRKKYSRKRINSTKFQGNFCFSLSKYWSGVYS